MRKFISTLVLTTVFAAGVCLGKCLRADATVAAAESPKLVVRLHRFQIKPDRSAEFDRWVAFEHAHHAETVATLEREQMYAETIFRDREHDPLTIYWAELGGAGGASVTTSTLPIDKVYEGFMQRTLVAGSHATLQPEYTLVPPFLLESIAAHEAAKRAGK